MAFHSLSEKIAAEFKLQAAKPHSTTKKIGEISHFRHLADILVSNSGHQIRVTELHGKPGLVTFSSMSPYTRTKPQCELSDLAVIVFSSGPSPSIRLAFIQAKFISKLHRRYSPPETVYEQNMEQWYVLARRPTITGAVTGSVPSNLLNNALLESVGGFLVFFNTCSDDNEAYVDAFYSVAANLKPIFPLTKAGKMVAGDLQIKIPRLKNVTHTEGCLPELYQSESLQNFIHGLLNQHIGTPLLSAEAPPAGACIEWVKKTIEKLTASNHQGGNVRGTPAVTNLMRIINSIPTSKDIDADQTEKDGNSKPPDRPRVPNESADESDPFKQLLIIETGPFD